MLFGAGVEEVDALSLPAALRSSWQRWPISRFMLAHRSVSGLVVRFKNYWKTRTIADRDAPHHRSYGSGDSRDMHG